MVNVNIGMPNKAVKGNNWRKHRRDLLLIFRTAWFHSAFMIGMLVAEAGSLAEPYDNEDRKKIEELFKEALRDDDIQIFWATGPAAETVMVFKPHVQVTMSPTIKMDWRRVEVAMVTGATEHLSLIHI